MYLYSHQCVNAHLCVWMHVCVCVCVCVFVQHVLVNKSHHQSSLCKSFSALFISQVWLVYCQGLEDIYKPIPSHFGRLAWECSCQACVHWCSDILFVGECGSEGTGGKNRHDRGKSGLLGFVCSRSIWYGGGANNVATPIISESYNVTEWRVMQWSLHPQEFSEQCTKLIIICAMYIVLLCVCVYTAVWTSVLSHAKQGIIPSTQFPLQAHCYYRDTVSNNIKITMPVYLFLFPSDTKIFHQPMQNKKYHQWTFYHRLVLLMEIVNY